MKTLFKFLTVIFALILIISTQNAIAQFTCGTDSVQDVDGNWYNTILIGSQCWFKENLRTTKYPDNTAITKGPISQTTTSWVSDQAFYSCPPNTANNGEDCTASGSLGLLYQWSAAMDGDTTEGAQGICPTGWHVPSDAEWKILEGSLGMSVLNQNSTGYRGTDEGSKMANDISGQSWNAGNLRSNAAFGSSGLDIGTTGYRHSSGDYYYRGLNTIMWTSTEAGTKAYMRYLYHIYSNVNRFPYAKALGACVRCVQDSVSSTASAGIYTIGKTGTQDYSSFNAAVNDLPSLVLNGPVVFNVASGTYTEKVDISNINGTASNTITFQSASGDSTDVILQDSSSGSTWTESFTLRLNNSDYFRFKKMTIKNTSTGPNGKVVDITGGSDHNELSNCVFQGHPTSTSAAHANIYSQGAINDNYNIIKNNHIIGGSYGIWMFGAGPPTYEIGNQILNNVFDNQNYCGFKCYYLDAYTFEGNEINMSPTQSKGIESYYTKNSVKILNNKISGSYGYGVYFSRHNSDSPYTDSALIANNFISMSGNGVFGVDCNFSKQTKWYYNSINISGSDTNTYGFKLTGNVAGYPGHIIRNNIISNKADGFAFYTSSANSTFDSDYNDLYTTGTNLGFTAVNWVWVMIPNLAAWRTATGGDANSITSLPSFVSTTDLHITTQLSSNGTPLTDITTDIDGELRSATTPDIGADEYSASYSSSLDAGIISISTSSVCEGSQDVSVELKNFGQTTLNSVQIGWKLNNINKTPYTWNGNLVSGDTITIIIATGFVFAPATSYYPEAYPILINSVADVNAINDTAKLINQMYYSLPAVNITTVSPLCENSNNVTLSATPSGGTYNGQGVSNNYFNPNNAGVGDHNVLYIFTDSYGCSNSDSTIIKVNANPIVDAGTDLSTYPGGSVNLSGSATGGSGFYSYSWLPPNLVANSTNASTSTTALSTSGYFTLYVIDDSTSCSSTDDIYITITGSSLSMSASSDKSAVCIGGNVVLNSSAIGGSNNYTYLWTSVPAGLNSTLSSLTVNPVVSTYYFLTVNDGSTTISDSVFVNVYSNPLVSISGINSNYCSLDFGSVVSVNPSGGTISGNGIGGSYFYPTTAGLGTHIITYSYIDGNGCSGSDSISTTVNLNPTVSITSTLSPSYCADANSVNLSASPSGGAYSGPGISGSLFNPSQANIGNNQITYSYLDGNGCTGSDMISTIVNSLPTVSITTTLSSSYCVDANSISLNASPLGGVYSGQGISGSSFNPSQANIGFNQIVYTYTDANSCTGSDTVNTTVVINPTVNISTTLSSSYCQNEAGITLTASPSGGTFSGSITSAYFDPSQVQPGQQNIIYSYTDGNGCTGSDSISTIVNSIPTVSITSSLNSSYCIDADSVNLSASPSGGTFSGPSITGSIFYPSQANIGNNQIMYSNTDGNGCTGIDIIYTIVNPLPTVVFTTTLDSNYCEDDSPVSLNAFPSGGVYSGQGVSGSSFNPLQANIGVNQLIYSFTDVNSCSNSDTISTNVSALPSVSFGTLSDVCSDVQQITLSGGNPSGGFYNGIAVNSNLGLFYPQISGNGNFSLSYTYTDANGCSNTATSNQKVKSIPTSSFTLPASICLDDTATIIYTGQAGVNAVFNWNFDNGIIYSGSGAGPYHVKWNSSGLHQVTLSVVDSGCTSQITANYVNVLASFAMITSVGSPSVCYGDSVTLFANTGANYNYQWYDTTGILSGDTLSYLNVSQSGTYHCEVTPPNSCSSISNVISVNVIPLPTASFSILSNTCVNDTVTLTYNGTAGSTAIYNWIFDIATVISGSGQGPYQLLWNSNGTKVISLTVIENNCVSLPFSSNIIVNSTEAIITAIGNTSFCDGDSVALYANTGANLFHQWFKNSNLIQGANNPFFIANSSGSYYVLITDIISGCSESSMPALVTVNSTDFNLAFTATPVSFSAPPFIVTTNNQTPNTNNYYFYWDLGDGNNSTFMQPFHTYQFDGIYTVTQIAENIQTGCRDTLVKPNYISCTGGSPNPCSVVAEITPSGSAIICVTDSLLLTATSAPGWIYQWLYNGVVIPGADTATFYGTLAGEYRVIVNDTVCTVTSNPFILGHHPSVIPVISSNDSIRPCTNDSMELYVSSFYNSYLWSTTETTQSIYVKYSANYTVTTTDINSCALVSAPFIVNASLLQPPEICLVGVDSFNHNRIIWERSSSALVDSFFVYRESTAAGVYNKIGQLDKTQASIFVDTNSNPAVRAYRYRLTASDTCGTETSMSPYHKTIHLTINKGLPGTYNLIWDGYHGFPFGSYAIYRGVDSTNLSLLTQIQSTLWSYTDISPPGDTVFYQIEVINPFDCYPDSIFSKANSNFNSSRSNVANTMAIVPTDTTGIIKVDMKSILINIYPNPNDGIFTVYINSHERNVPISIGITVYNLLGERVYAEQIQSFKGNHKHNLNLSTLPKGIYNIVVMNDKFKRVGKVVIQ